MRIHSIIIFGTALLPLILLPQRAFPQNSRKELPKAGLAKPADKAPAARVAGASADKGPAAREAGASADKGPAAREASASSGAEQNTRTPTLARFVKSEDDLQIALSYFHNWLAKIKFGPFISMGIQTAGFPGHDVRSKDTVVKRFDLKEKLISTETIPAKGDIKLTKAFAPIRLKQSLGFFGDLLDKTAIKLHMEAGLAFVKLAVRGGFKVEDNGETPELELKKLQDAFEVGGQFKLQLNGILKKIIEYSLELEIMHPFAHTADTALRGFDLTNVEFSLKLEFRFTKWASLIYTFNISRLPLLSTEWQTRNALLLTLTANLI